MRKPKLKGDTPHLVKERYAQTTNFHNMMNPLLDDAGHAAIETAKEMEKQKLRLACKMEIVDFYSGCQDAMVNLFLLGEFAGSHFEGPVPYRDVLFLDLPDTDRSCSCIFEKHSLFGNVL